MTAYSIRAHLFALSNLYRRAQESELVPLVFNPVAALMDKPAIARKAIRGTPAFIAPEQALGGSDQDGRTGIYATGCVAYWLLTGALVFTADTAMGLLLHHWQTPPAAPSSRTGRSTDFYGRILGLADVGSGPLPVSTMAPSGQIGARRRRRAGSAILRVVPVA